MKCEWCGSHTCKKRWFRLCPVCEGHGCRNCLNQVIIGIIPCEANDSETYGNIIVCSQVQDPEVDAIISDTMASLIQTLTDARDNLMEDE